MESKLYGYTAQSKFGAAHFTYRPLLNIKVGSETKSRTFKALVDSGTEITVMDQSIADLLEIGSEGKERAQLSGLETWREGFIAPVFLEVDGFDEVFTFRVLFIEDLQRNFDIILGQQDFFLNFIITFKKAENSFALKRMLVRA